MVLVLATVARGFGSRAGLFDAVGRELAARSANRDVYRALRSMAQLDEQSVGGVVRRMDEERAAGMTRLMSRLADQRVLREDLSVEDAEHVLWMLTSFESFDLLYTGRGLSIDRTVELLIDAAERALYAEPYTP
jgi:hypothetical protein